MEIVPDRNYSPVEVNITEEPKAHKLAIPLLILVLILFISTPVFGQSRFGGIKDEQKRGSVGRVEESLNRLNQKQIIKLKVKASRMGEIQDLLQVQILALETDGANVDELNIIMKLNQESLDKLLADLEEQENKVFIPELLDESLLRQKVGESISLLKSDLEILSQDLLNIKDGLIKVVKQIISLKQLLNMVPEVTPAGSN